MGDWSSGLLELAKPFIASSVRHTVGGFGVWLVHKGVIDSSQANEFVGTVMFLAAIGWSFWQKIGHAMMLTELERLRGK
jgi:hypothetical protein